jgi:predicted small lipoprotein YifL
MRLFLLLTTAILLSACGQKGPLYLPDNPSVTSDTVVMPDETIPVEQAEAQDGQR